MQLDSSRTRPSEISAANSQAVGFQDHVLPALLQPLSQVARYNDVSSMGNADLTATCGHFRV